MTVGARPTSECRSSGWQARSVVPDRSAAAARSRRRHRRTRASTCRTSCSTAPRPAAGLWRGRRFVDCTFHDADLRGLVTERCTFDGCRFRGTDLGDSVHRGSAFRSCTFERTTLSGATFAGCSLLGSTVLDSRLRPLDAHRLRPHAGRARRDRPAAAPTCPGCGCGRRTSSTRTCARPTCAARTCAARACGAPGSTARTCAGRGSTPRRSAGPGSTGATVDVETALAFAAAHGLRIG